MQYGGVYLSLYLIYISVYICFTHFFFEDSNCIYVEFLTIFIILAIFSMLLGNNIHYFLYSIFILFKISLDPWGNHYLQSYYRSVDSLGISDFLSFVGLFFSCSLQSSAHWFFFLSFVDTIYLWLCHVAWNLSSLTRYQTPPLAVKAGVLTTLWIPYNLQFFMIFSLEFLPLYFVVFLLRSNCFLLSSFL